MKSLTTRFRISVNVNRYLSTSSKINIQIPSLRLFQQALQNQSLICIQQTSPNPNKHFSQYRYLDLLHDSSRIAQFLRNKHGGDLNESRVVFLAPPSFQYVALQWAIWSAGGICVPLHPGHQLPEIDYIIKDSSASYVIWYEERDGKDNGKGDDIFKPIREAMSSSPSCPTFIPLPSHLFSPPSSFCDITSPSSTPFSSSSSSCNSPLSSVDTFDMKFDRRAMIIYTSGTTGRPKGVVSTHSMIESQVKCLVDAWEYSKMDHILHTLPLHHVHGVINALTCMMWSGGRVSFLRRFESTNVWNLFMNVPNLNLFMGVPTMYAKLIAQFDQSDEKTQRAMKECCKKFRLMVSGSAALPESVMKKWENISGHRLLERYGMTEIGMALSNPLHGLRKAGSVGKPLPGVMTKIVGDEKQGGELRVKGPSVFREYWNKPDATKQSFDEEGWFCTGDITAIDDDGYYRILGRSSADIIKSGGYKISALEIERDLLEHPAIKECAVVGIPNEEFGQIIGAVVVSTQPDLDLKSLQQWCRDKMATHKIPRKLILVQSIPTNAMGKINKKQLLSLFSQ